jgi:hypothetical protein
MASSLRCLTDSPLLDGLQDFCRLGADFLGLTPPFCA